MVLEIGKPKSVAQTSDWLKSVAQMSDWSKSMKQMFDWLKSMVQMGRGDVKGTGARGSIIFCLSLFWGLTQSFEGNYSHTIQSKVLTPLKVAMTS